MEIATAFLLLGVVDDFTRTELGDIWETNDAARGVSGQSKIVDGVLNVQTSPKSKHGGAISTKVDYRDVIIQLRFRLKSEGLFKLVLNDKQCPTVHSGHIARLKGKGDPRDVSSDVQAAIVMCGPMNLLSPGIVERVDKAVGKPRGDAIIDFMGGALPRQKTSIYREASPLTHVSKHTPSVLFINGEFDRPRIRYTEFWDKLDQHKIPHKFVLVPKAPNPFLNMREWFTLTINAVDQFLQKHLSK